MSNDVGTKLKVIRKSEWLTQKEIAELVSIPSGTYIQYEQGKSKPGMEAIIKIFKHPRFRKYRDWFMFDEVDPETGQIAPALAHIGQEVTTSLPSDEKTG